MLSLPQCPVVLKRIAHYLKTAQEHENRDIVVTYWCLLYALQMGLKISTKTSEETNLLIAIMEWLEKTKKENHSNEAITNEVVAQAYLENYALKLFQYAYQQDLAAQFGKNVVKAFYTAGMVYDVLLTFGELSEEAQNNSKYAKWKATYIHNCLKNGETPVAGPSSEFDGELLGIGSGGDGNIEDTNFDAGTSLTTPTKSTTNIGFSMQPQDKPTDMQPGCSSNSLGDNASDSSTTVVTNVPSSFVDKNTGSNIDNTNLLPSNTTNVNLSAEQIGKAQKYCKWAGSALNYEDVKAAIDNLQKALILLQTGQDD